MDYTWRRATRQRRRGKIRQTNLDQRQCTAPSSFLKTILRRRAEVGTDNTARRSGNVSALQESHSPNPIMEIGIQDTLVSSTGHWTLASLESTGEVGSLTDSV